MNLGKHIDALYGIIDHHEKELSDRHTTSEKGKMLLAMDVIAYATMLSAVWEWASLQNPPPKSLLEAVDNAAKTFIES